MVSAAIDVGSNTIRLLIGLVREKRLHRLHSDRVITRLAKGLKETGYLNSGNVESSIKAMREISHVISRYNAKEIKAVGTAALRNAINGADFIERVFRETGIKIKIITGEEEARLTVRGVLSGLNIGDSLIVDIGGGSTELIIFDSKKSDASIFWSMPIGVITLFEDYIRNDPPSSAELGALEGYIEGRIKQQLNNTILPAFGVNTFVGTGGTITTLAAIDLSLDDYKPEVIHGHSISLDRLKDIRDRLLSLPVSLRKDIKGLEPKRADLIIPGIILTIKLMDVFGFGELIVSDYGLLEGLLLEEGGKDEKGL